ncbi:hypothetical protein [Novosphingobium sp.]|uniref:hypothetical protein n=1 Tax=Novosphingobium sp. TaxID=1874826 RepID=UPI003BAD4D44
MDAHRFFPANRLLALRVALASAATALSLLLSGCDADRVSALEERVTAVEAKADAAEKKAKAAEALAVTNQPQPISQPEPVVQNNDNPDGDDPAASVDDGGDPAPPPPPMADNGKG